MADFALTGNQLGVYELPLPADQAVEVAVHSTSVSGRPQIQVIHHGGATPLYVGFTDDVEPRDPAAMMVMPATYAEMPVPSDGSIWLVSESPATVSVTRA